MSSSQPRSFPTAPVAVTVAVLAVLAGLWLGADWSGQRKAGPGPAAVQLQGGTALPQPKPLAPFTLIDQDGRDLTQAGLRGHWTFAAIGYTTCPDVCPMTMATYVALQRQIVTPAGGPGPQFLLISVDPERDTPERLAQYVRHFHPGFLGATGPEDVLKRLTRDLGGLYVRVEDTKSALGYTMDHSASIYLIDPEGRLAAIFSTPHDPAIMARDFKALVQAALPQT